MKRTELLETTASVLFLLLQEKIGKKHTIPIDMVCLWVYSNTNTNEMNYKGAQE